MAHAAEKKHREDKDFLLAQLIHQQEKLQISRNESKNIGDKSTHMTSSKVDSTDRDHVKKSRRKDRFKNVDVSEDNSTKIDTSQVHPREDISHELEELFQRGIISSEQFQKLNQRTNLSTSEYVPIENLSNKRINGDYKENDMFLTDSECYKPMIAPFPFKDNGIPVNWTGNITNMSGASNIHNVIVLEQGMGEYDSIKGEMEQAGLIVTKIERLENIYLLNRFKTETEDIIKHRRKGFNVNIRYLYHGTKVDKSRICEEGLDQRLSRMGYFGKGIYFSDNPLKCVHYAKDHQSLEESYILKCRVILGESKHFPKGEYDISLQREPEKPNHVESGWRFYDSVVGCPKDYNEYVVYENRRAMIEYIISFSVDQTGDRELKTRAPSLNSFSTEEESRPVTDDSYGDKIQEIRESIRRKRCLEKGEVYVPPNEEKMKSDREMWLRLQSLHKRPQSTGQSCTSIHKDFNAELDTEHNSKGLDSVDPVDEVLDSLVTDFLAVTATDNIEAAKYYIERSQMDVDKAITMYFEEM